MIEVFDTTAARIALARRMLGCPGCGQPLRPWGRARERTVRDTGGTLLTIRPDRALCTGCGVTHVVLDAGVLDAGVLPRRGYAAGLIVRALAAFARGNGHRPIASGLAVPGQGPCCRRWPWRRGRRASGTPWLATAGSGDVLSGLAGALLAQGVLPVVPTRVSSVRWPS